MALIASAALVSAVTQRAGDEPGLHRHGEPRARIAASSANSRAIAGAAAVAENHKVMPRISPSATSSSIRCGCIGIRRLRWTKLPIGFNCDCVRVVLPWPPVIARRSRRAARHQRQPTPERARRGARRRTAWSPPAEPSPSMPARGCMSAGGNAIDGGVASIFAAAVVEISHFGLGGEAPIIIYSARDKRVIVINGQGPAPKAATPALFAGKDADSRQRAARGDAARRGRFGVDRARAASARSRSSDVLQPAIELADGFPMYEFLHHYLETRARGVRAVRVDDADLLSGRTRSRRSARRSASRISPRRCARWRRPSRRRWRAGATREQAIEAGRDAFYKGPIARDMTAAVREAGGVMTEDDLAGYHGKIEEPASAPYRGYTVYKAGFWNQGPALLQTLRILEGFDLRAMGAGLRRRAAHDGRSDQAGLRRSRSLLRRSGLRPRARRRAAVGALRGAAPRA